ncbi:MAG: hypothetical protein M3162_05830 [Thermoproteota archaeon]|nr:hypothetical protein [Thermoproteota archaeon]
MKRIIKKKISDQWGRELPLITTLFPNIHLNPDPTKFRKVKEDGIRATG